MVAGAWRARIGSHPELFPERFAQRDSARTRNAASTLRSPHLQLHGIAHHPLTHDDRSGVACLSRHPWHRGAEGLTSLQGGRQLHDVPVAAGPLEGDVSALIPPSIVLPNVRSAGRPITIGGDGVPSGEMPGRVEVAERLPPAANQVFGCECPADRDFTDLALRRRTLGRES